jgi:acyl dehydratase
MASISPSFDDFAIGSRFKSSREIQISAEQIKSFAAEFDPQPLHLDDEAARLVSAGGIIASGWHTAAVSMRLILDSDLPLTGRGVGMAVESMHWRTPVRAGDRLRLEGTVTEIRPTRSHAAREIIKFHVTVYNHQDAAVLDATHVVLVARRGAAPLIDLK